MFFIQSAMPPITAIPVVVERVGGDGNIANQFLVSSSLFSLLSIPFVMYLFSRFVGGGVLF
jgi:predicted permease